MRWLRRPAAVLALAALTTGVAGCGGGGGTTNGTKSNAGYSTLVAGGLTLLHEGNVNAAEQLFAQAIAKNPKGAVAYYDLGVVYGQLGKPAAAGRMYRRALAADHTFVPALYNLAVTLGGRNRPLAVQTAMFYYRKVIELQPDSPTAFLNLGLLEARKKALHDQALRDLSHALRLDPALRDQVPAALRAQVGTARSS